MRKIWDKWNSWSLILRIVCGLAIGTVLALIVPNIEWISLLGTLFVTALKSVAPILVFFLVIAALSNAKQSGAMKMVILLYIVSTLIAGVVAVVLISAFPVHLTQLEGLAETVTKTAPSDVGSVLVTLLSSLVANPVDSLIEPNFLGILMWAILLGIALRAASDNTRKVFADIGAAVSTLVRWIIAFAPFGVAGLVYDAVSTTGMGIFIDYGKLILVLVVAMLIIALVTNPAIVAICIHKNPYRLVLRCLKDSGITAFFTRSSAANIPINMELCRKLGLNKNNYSVAIPLGATINMAGACVTISVMAMSAAQTLDMQVALPTAIILCVLAAVSACGASGVPGGSLLLIPVACSLLGVPNDIAMQVVGVGFIIGVIQDSCETAVNSSSDVVFCATAEYMQWNRLGKKFVPGKDAPEGFGESDAIDAQKALEEQKQPA